MIKTLHRVYIQHIVRCGLIFLIIVLFLSSGLALTLVLIDYNVFKPYIAKWLKENKQRTLTINGDIQIAFFPRTIVQINDLVLSEHQNDNRPFATIKYIQLTPAIWPLLHQHISINQIVIDGLHVQLARYADGRMSIDDLLNPTDEASSLTIDIAQTEITDGQFLVRDDMTRQQVTLGGLNLKTGQITVESIEQVTLHAPFRVTDMDKNQDMHFTMHFDTEKISLDKNEPIGGPATLVIQNTASDQQLTMTLAISDVLQLAPPHDPSSRAKIKANLNSKRDTQTLQITLDTMLSIQSDNQQLHFSDLETQVDFFHADYFQKPVRGRLAGYGNIDLRSGLLQTELQGMLVDSPLYVTAHIQNATKPELNIDIQVDVLDLDALLTESAINTESVPAQHNELSQNTITLPDLSFLEKLDLGGSIKIGELSVGDAQFSGIQVLLTSAQNDSEPSLPVQ